MTVAKVIEFYIPEQLPKKPFHDHPEGFEIELESNGRNALKRYCERGPYDMVLIDFRLPGLSGADLALVHAAEDNANRHSLVLICNCEGRGRPWA